MQPTRFSKWSPLNRREGGAEHVEGVAWRKRSRFEPSDSMSESVSWSHFWNLKNQPLRSQNLPWLPFWIFAMCHFSSESQKSLKSQNLESLDDLDSNISQISYFTIFNVKLCMIHRRSHVLIWFFCLFVFGSHSPGLFMISKVQHRFLFEFLRTFTLQLLPRII